MKHCLFGSDLGDGRQDAAGVAGEEDDIGRVGRGEARDFGVVDVLDGVGAVGAVSVAVGKPESEQYSPPGIFC